VEAFGATLEETRLADLILHIVDGSAEEGDRISMIRAVDDVLAEIGASEVPRMLVLGKVDCLDEDGRAELHHRHPDAIQISSLTGEGLPQLSEAIEAEFARRLRPVELLIPYSDGSRLAELHEIAGDLVREDTPDGVRVSARLPGPVADRFAAFALEESAVAHA
jgi:GTP-binding protein HflX